MRTLLAAFFLLLSVSSPAFAGDLRGKVTDRTGGALPGAVVTLLNVASGAQVIVAADATGSFRFPDVKSGTYRVAAAFTGFSEGARTVVVADGASEVLVNFALELGSVKAEVTVAADRGPRDAASVPLRTDTITADRLRELAPVSTGDALVTAPGVTPVGSGPFQARPRLRGLDSTRVLVLVDGARLNNARTATDRAGVEVGLVGVDAIDSLEVLGGAGSVLYGTDALSGTINIITNQPRLSNQREFAGGFDGLYSSNESGQRGAVTLGLSDRRWAIRFIGGAERYDDYSAGRNFGETSQPFFDAGTLVQSDTIDDGFGFNFNRFPDPFNAPFTRTSALIPRSGMDGSSLNVAGTALVTAKQTIDVKYQRRHADNVGFPDFQQPYFFQTITLPWSRLDRISASYSITDIAPWLQKLTATSYYQRQDRLLRNEFPVQFPVPSPAFFPINVRRLDIQSDTRQQVWTPGVDVQATFLTRPDNVLTAGVTVFRDRSEDERTTTTRTSTIGQETLGMFGPAATVFASPVPLGSPAVDHPVRVPNASFRDVGVFIHNEWTATSSVRVTGGLRLDGYSVTTDATPGYNIDALVTGAAPAIDPATLPDINGSRISRKSVTGEAGVVLWGDRAVNLFGHYVHSYRHPNLEELLFAGPATAGNIVPNVAVKPETGDNVDVGARVRAAGLVGSIAYFNNTYRDFISTEVVSSSPAGSLSQAINLAKVRIQGVEARAEKPIVAAGLVWSPSAAVAYTRGTVLAGTIPATGASIAGAPQDNITPWKISAGVRVSDRRDAWWGAYGVRMETDVTRVSPLLSESDFLIAQDLFGLGGFAVQRLSAGYNWRQGGQRLGLTVAVDNLTDRFYREQFQFAPARGRSLTIALHVRGLK
jgi:hemoglobin/transferrin/lactoferrin receptor protein